MSMRVQSPLVVTATFLWIGFVCAISFMEAWLKFQAPGVTLSIGLGIGRLVFGVLNKVEWVLAVAIVIGLMSSKTSLFKGGNFFFLIPLVLLLIQSIWMLPKLDERALQHIQEGDIANSNLHFYYVGAEVIKLACLLVFGIKQFQEIKEDLII
jgi:hypothetical protein